MRICLGEKIALVGLNGAGKSTLFKLLLRFYDPTEGGIFLDGTDIKSFDIDQYRRLFSGVFQDFNIYCASIAQNIAMDSDYDPQEIAGAGAQIGLGAILERHGISYESRLGREVYDDGTNLSGGEKQKIAIARPFMAGSAGFCLLDEPNSYLDAESEHAVMRAIDKNFADIAVVIISHRLSSIADAEHIYLLDNGRVLESGTHSELLSLGGEYARMYRVQAKRYA